MKIAYSDGALLDAAMTAQEGKVSVRCDRATYCAPVQRFANGETRLYPGLLQCGIDAAKDEGELLCCGSCLHFRFSGMSDQMSAGRQGYCGKVGFRSKKAVVSVEHLCGEHERIACWPADEGTLLEERMAVPKSTRGLAFSGCMLGLAVGDALGFPTEFRSHEQILKAFGPQGVTDMVALHDPRWPEPPYILGTRHPAGTYSDDTQMTIAVARGLLEAPDESTDATMNAIARFFVDWSRSDDNNRAPGGTCMTGCANLAQGVPWREAGVADSKGCGSAMRVAPIGLVFWRDQARLLELAKSSSLLTHGHPAGIAGAAAAALLVALALEKQSPSVMHAMLIETLGGQAKDLDRRLEQLPAMLEQPPEIALSEAGLGESWVAEEAVVSALYCFWRSPADFARTVLTAANTNGDSDSIACIAGAISGAFNGLDSIPLNWRRTIEGADELMGLAARLEAYSTTQLMT